MNPLMIPGWNNVLRKPKNWDDRKGACVDLYVRARMKYGLPEMVSSWRPSPAELAALNRGLPLLITVLGRTHPPIMPSVGTTADLPLGDLGVKPEIITLEPVNDKGNGSKP